MKICGIELTRNEAIISLVLFENDIFHLPQCRVRRIQCQDPDNRAALRYFQKSFAKLVEDYKIDALVIKQRMKKGRYAGSADSFKLEAALQLLEDSIEVQLISAIQIKENLKKYPLPIRFEETGLKKFQQTAFMTAFAYIGGQYQW